IIHVEVHFKSRGEHVEASRSWNRRVGPANGSGDFRVAVLRTRRTADAGRASSRMEVLRPRKCRANSVDPALPGRRFRAGGGSYVYRGGESGSPPIDAPDGSQASGTRGIYRSSNTCEGADRARARLPTSRTLHVSRLSRRAPRTPQPRGRRFQAADQEGIARSFKGLMQVHELLVSPRLSGSRRSSGGRWIGLNMRRLI